MSPEEAEEQGLALLRHDNPEAEWEVYAPTPPVVTMAEGPLVKNGVRGKTSGGLNPSRPSLLRPCSARPPLRIRLLAHRAEIIQRPSTVPMIQG